MSSFFAKADEVIWQQEAGARAVWPASGGILAAALRHRHRHCSLRHRRRILSSQSVGRRRPWRSHPGEYHQRPPSSLRPSAQSECPGDGNAQRGSCAPPPKAKQQEDQTAIPIHGKPKKPEQQQTQRVPLKTQPVPDNKRAIWRAGRLCHAESDPIRCSHGPTTLTDANFGSLFGCYVDNINRKMDANGYRSLADPHTPKGAKASIEFRIHRDGSQSDVRLDRSSGSPTWDSVCVRAAQRVDTFGSLPAGYRDSYLQVYFDCTY